MLRVKNLMNLAGDKLHSLPMLVLYLTDGCNSRCLTCDIWQNPRRNMPMPLVETLVDASGDLGLRYVLLSGGEAMQHPEWPAIARKFRETGAHVMLLTNGLLLKKQAQDVLDSVDEVIVSLDGGNAKTYAAIRGVDAFDLIFEGIDMLRAAGMPITTRTTVQQANFREIPQIIEVALKHDVNKISFLAIDVSNPFAFGERDTETANGALSTNEIQQLGDIIDSSEKNFASAFADGRMAESAEKLRRILLEYFKALIGEAEFPRPRCNAPHFSTVVEVDGRLRPCYFLPTYGRLKPEGEGLAAAINWQAAQDLRRAYRTGQRAECARCVCPLYKSPRNLLGI
jgi:MoaA/NifB/PqqE/SkfB family radical SAM enzyme